MPLREVQFPLDMESPRSRKEEILIFFSSRVAETNLLWCPDCVAVEKLIVDTFNLEQGPSAVLVYVGQRSEWKSPDNIFRKEPWNVTSIPTIIKLNNAGQETGRLVDGQNLVSEELSSFLGQWQPSRGCSL
ncbi:hypothetical protein PAXRUDRAFT_691165 [Paxillus rubicundulus Ve08.2h10]|uniref:Thioredoxin domain-containing protein n=1 Tax=Paxillus rubicundulus Ve08.2h10 TaxID=930991 RepID=A0A0D0DWW3_9AGAM|nr:hypothetical protein PAXRUDRAFT_691165 [Paxillus rubicundulus Ve08.2h10]